MRYYSPQDAMILRRRAMGVAAIAAEKQNFQNINRGLPQKNYINNDMLRRGGSFGSLGVVPGTTGAVVSGVRSIIGAPKGEGAVAKIEDASHAAGMAVTSSAAATATATALASYGAIAGPIGAAVGLVVGLAIGALTKKNYANLAQINALMDHEVLTLSAYQKVAGKAAGRHYGLPAMEAVWRGGIEKGLFPKMQSKMHYHEGWTKYIGGAEQASKVIREAFPRALAKFRVWKNSQSKNIPTTSVTPRVTAIVTPRAGMNLRGLGSLGAVGATAPDAVIFVENFLRLDPDTDIPPTTTGGPAAMQIVYDAADAFLAKQSGLNTVPYMPGLPKLPPKSVAVAKPVAKPVAKGYVQPVAKTSVGPGSPNTGGGGFSTGTSSPVGVDYMSPPPGATAPAIGAPVAANPSAPAAPNTPGAVAAPAAAGIPWGLIATVGAAVLM